MSRSIWMSLHKSFVPQVNGEWQKRSWKMYESLCGAQGPNAELVILYHLKLGGRFSVLLSSLLCFITYIYGRCIYLYILNIFLIYVFI